MKIYEIDTLKEHPIVSRTIHYCSCRYVKKEKYSNGPFAFFLIMALIYMSLVTGIIIGRFFLVGILK